ncbi:hypothetical protein Stok01_02478 [Sulfurisphaera tokodaii]
MIRVAYQIYKSFCTCHVAVCIYSLHILSIIYYVKRTELTEMQQRVLLFLLENDGSAFRDISDKTESNPNAIKKAIDELMELGLVYDKREDTFPRRRLIYLTEYGKEVAKRLKEIVEIINESSKHPQKPSVEV